MKDKNFKKIVSSKTFLTIIKILVIIIVLVFAGYLTYSIWPIIKNFNDHTAMESLKNKLTSFEPYSWFILLGIQILQVVVAIIPGEPVEIVSGVMYGTFGGLLICLIGSLIGSIIIFYLVRWLGKDLINKIFESEKISKLKFLNNNKNLELLVALLFFIPGTPKDLLTYFVPLTKIKPSRFFIISTFAKIPSIITSTYGGATLQDGNFIKAIIIFTITGVIGIAGILIHNRIINRQNRTQNSDEQSNSEK